MSLTTSPLLFIVCMSVPAKGHTAAQAQTLSEAIIYAVLSATFTNIAANYKHSLGTACYCWYDVVFTPFLYSADKQLISLTICWVSWQLEEPDVKY